MEASELKTKQWYYVRRPGGAMVPYRFHRIANSKSAVAEFFVGSFICEIPLKDVIAEARMPRLGEKAD